MSKSILALDLAKRTGYAHWREGDAKASAGVLDIKGDDIGDRLASVFKWTWKKAEDWQLTDICVEAPLTTAGSQEKIWWLVSAYGVIKMLGSQRRISVVPIANATMFIHLCGTNTIEGPNRKTQAVLEVQRRGFPNVQDHNTADAIGLLSLQCCKMGLKTPWDSLRSPGPLFTGGHGKPAGTTITKSNQVAAQKLINRIGSFDRGE